MAIIGGAAGDGLLLDARAPGEYLRERLGELAKDETIYICRQSGLRSHTACRSISGGYGMR